MLAFFPLFIVVLVVLCQTVTSFRLMTGAGGNPMASLAPNKGMRQISSAGIAPAQVKSYLQPSKNLMSPSAQALLACTRNDQHRRGTEDFYTLFGSSPTGVEGLDSLLNNLFPLEFVKNLVYSPSSPSSSCCPATSTPPSTTSTSSTGCPFSPNGSPDLARVLASLMSPSLLNSFDHKDCRVIPSGQKDCHGITVPEGFVGFEWKQSPNTFASVILPESLCKGVGKKDTEGQCGSGDSSAAEKEKQREADREKLKGLESAVETMREEREALLKQSLLLPSHRNDEISVLLERVREITNRITEREKEIETMKQQGEKETVRVKETESVKESESTTTGTPVSTPPAPSSVLLSSPLSLDKLKEKADALVSSLSVLQDGYNLLFKLYEDVAVRKDTRAIEFAKGRLGIDSVEGLRKELDKLYHACTRKEEDLAILKDAISSHVKSNENEKERERLIKTEKMYERMLESTSASSSLSPILSLLGDQLVGDIRGMVEMELKRVREKIALLDSNSNGHSDSTSSSNTSNVSTSSSTEGDKTIPITTSNTSTCDSNTNTNSTSTEGDNDHDDDDSDDDEGADDDMMDALYEREETLTEQITALKEREKTLNEVIALLGDNVPIALREKVERVRDDLKEREKELEEVERDIDDAFDSDDDDDSDESEGESDGKGEDDSDDDSDDDEEEEYDSDEEDEEDNEREEARDKEIAALKDQVSELSNLVRSFIQRETQSTSSPSAGSSV